MAVSPALESAARRQSLGERITGELREAIISGRYEPGERLTEIRLGADFGVSRVPVREALRTMESEGFVVVTSFTERVVAAMSPEDMRDLYDMREAVELLTVVRAAERSDSSGRKDLIRLLAEGMNLVSEGHDEDLAALNARFHHAIASASGSALLLGMFSQLDAKIRWSHFGNRGDARWRDSWMEHAAIVQAIVAGDAQQARHLMRGHLGALRDQAMQRVQS